MIASKLSPDPWADLARLISLRSYRDVLEGWLRTREILADQCDELRCQLSSVEDEIAALTIALCDLSGDDQSLNLLNSTERTISDGRKIN